MNGDCNCGCRPCDCCEGIRIRIPESHDRSPGLAKVEVRVGAHGTFLASLNARLSTHELVTEAGDGGDGEQRSRPLAALSVRDADATIALLDAWATAADVLGFYSTRIVNEGYLRTATEERSLHELARLPGYKPRPGVSASTYLAYTIDPTAVGDVAVRAGSRALTVPGQDEEQQTFETSDDLMARAEWNVMQARQDALQMSIEEIRAQGLWLKGTATRLKPDDALLISEKGGFPQAFRAVTVDAIPDLDRTRVGIEDWDHLSPDLRDLLESVPRHGGSREVARRLSLRLDSGEREAVLREIEAQLDGQLSPPVRNWMKKGHNILRAMDEGEPEPEPEARPNVWRKLLERPSAPLTNANLLARSTDDFRAASAGTLKVVSSTNAALTETLGPALSGYRSVDSEPPLRVFAPRLQAGPFGRSFPRPHVTIQTRNDDGTTSTTTRQSGDWSIVRPITEREDLLYLDASYEGIATGSWLLIDMRGAAVSEDLPVRPADSLVLARAMDIHPRLSRAEYGQSADTTAITLDQPWLRYDDEEEEHAFRVDDSFEIIRRSTVYAASEELEPAEAPFLTKVRDGADEAGIELDRVYLGLEPGRLVALQGERADVEPLVGIMAAEVAMIAKVVHGTGGALMLTPGTGEDAGPDRLRTRIWLEKPLTYSYQRRSLEILGNVVRATHGKTNIETLGNGDGSVANQSFTLKQSPVTHLAAATRAGSKSSLSVFVDDLRWQHVDSFVDLSPQVRGYMESRDDKGETTVIFGDGVNGARTPTGIMNVEAFYRQGIGKAGNAKTSQVSQLGDRPLGVRGVVNPVRASGGADREAPELIRRSIPLASASLGRLVATRDYADFARGFAGIAKADARLVAAGGRRIVHLTIAGIDDMPIDLDSELMRSLRSALLQLGDPAMPLVIATRELLPLIVQARVRIDEDRRWEDLAVAIRMALLSAFGFDARDLAQGVAAGELVAAIQRVPGVSWVDMELFGTLPPFTDAEVPTPDQIAAAVSAIQATDLPRVIQSRPARRANGGLAAAQLIVFAPGADATIALNQA